MRYDGKKLPKEATPMNSQEERSFSLLPLLLPAAASLLVVCAAAGYLLYRFCQERAYRARWRDYDGCGV